ncbi:polysaccharide deacetylase family protein [Niallia oryzisoli]|uniref:polysaccharide deacetylase family protein n=1 Tax=Niallia oryzisoli TaxID=1737571 RepID=UPI003734DCD8
MKLYEYARKINKKIKQRRKDAAGRYLSAVRRIERVAPIKNGRYVAMTFDDGPMNLPPNPINEEYQSNHSLTALLIEILGKYHAKGTFNVIGTTENNYPDKIGKLHSPTWGGQKHDHYPKFNEDKHAGAKNQRELIQSLIENGHELSNHGHNHVLFGPNKIVYGSRSHMKSISDVYNDLNNLHQYLQDEFNYQLKLSRPPHYIDTIPDGYNSYDAYAMMQYQYLAASFDGGGWLPTEGNYQADIDKMVKPLENALRESSDSLNGQIIFQKDGYNMSIMTPVGHALPKHLELLTNEGYQVITVSDLLKLSPFEDIDTDAEYLPGLIELDQAGYIIGYRNNTFHPERTLTKGEMVMMSLTKKELADVYKEGVLDRNFQNNMKKHPYYAAYSKYGMLDTLSQSNDPATSEDIRKFFYERLNKDVHVADRNELLRRDYVEVLNNK